MNAENWTRRRFISRSVAGGLAAGVVSELAGRAIHAAGIPVEGGGLSLHVTGDERQGFATELFFDGKRIVRSGSGGEFSGLFKNEERSVEDQVGGWRSASWSGDSRRALLRGHCALTNLNTTMAVEVEYEVVTPHVVRKTIRLQQADMFLLFYQLSNRLEAAETPAKFWSFDQPDWKGEAAREYFPAAGFRTNNGVCVGLLTDAGYRNQWTRLIRRDGKPVKPAPWRVPDARLYTGSEPEQLQRGEFFVQQTFGELLEWGPEDRLRAQSIALPDMASWKTLSGATFQAAEGAATISTRNGEEGVLVRFAAEGPGVYSVSAKYRSTGPIAIEIWDVDAKMHKISDITQYDDGWPDSAGAWTEMETTVFVPGLRGSGCAVFISAAPSEQGKSLDGGAVAKIELRDLEIRRVPTRSEPYHRIEMDRWVEKTVFIFADEEVEDSVRGYRLASQLHLADGLRFKGGETEKVVYADLMMLSWIAGPESLRPILAPSIWYSAAGEMYLRDSFFALNGVHNRELNESVFQLWGENQGEDGAINTLVEPNLANVERKSNDSTPLWLMWALLNQRRFGTVLPKSKVRKAAEYCMRAYDPRRTGICSAQFVMGQLDVIRYPQGTSIICENQGVWAVLLRTIRELRIEGLSGTIGDDYLGKAEEAYRSYYDPVKKFMRPARDIDDAIGFAEIFPEFLSLWLFQRKILSDEAVVNHLDRIPTMVPRAECPHPEAGGTVRPILIGLPRDGQPWRYFTEKWHPMISDSFAESYANHGADGIYYNGGSWMRIEVCGYVAGKLHGWSRAKEAIENRLWAEIHIAPEFPTSQEYLATAAANPFYGYHRVFAWNSFVCQALEMAGMRGAEMDPDYSRK
jgi:hypothetical protein